MAYDARREGTVLFGGRDLPDTWVWDGTLWTSQLVSDPGGHDGTAMAYDTDRGVTVLFGGDHYPFPSLGTWEWDGTSWTERAFRDPGARWAHAMAYDAARRVTVLVGGFPTWNFRGDVSDTWEWNGTTWTRRLVAGPSARGAHAMAYDSHRGVTVLFGGISVDGISPETWEWDGTTWTLRMVDGPPPRWGHAMAYDAARGVTVLFGGENDDSGPCSPFADTWEWDGVAWMQRVIPGPPPRSGHAMAYDAARNTTVMFGGDADGATWELRVACRADFNNDGRADSGDLFDFLVAFFAGDADFNTDGVANSQDFFDFVTALFAGC